MKRLVLCSVFLLWSIFAIAQSNTTKKGKTILDISIIINNLKKGTTTNINGNYTFTLPENHKKLRFSIV